VWVRPPVVTLAVAMEGVVATEGLPGMAERPRTAVVPPAMEALRVMAAVPRTEVRFQTAAGPRTEAFAPTGLRFLAEPSSVALAAMAPISSLAAPVRQPAGTLAAGTTGSRRTSRLLKNEMVWELSLLRARLFRWPG
jgi:hypothetical protein